MDAIKRHWQVIRALLLARPLVVVMLGLFYPVGWLIALTSDAPKKGVVILVMAAIPACGFFALATERLIQFSAAGSSLGIPGHVPALRHGQIDVMCLVIGVPAIIALLEGAPFNSSALLCVPAAAGVFLTLYARWIFPIWIILFVSSRVAESYHFAADFTSPVIQVALLVASVPTLIWWLGLASRVQARTRPLLRLADRRHERTVEARGEALAVDSDRLTRYEESLDRALTSIVAGVNDTGPSSDAFSLGLGFDLRPRWTRIVKVVAVGLLLIVILQDTQRRNLESGLYLTMTAFAGLNLLSRLQIVLAHWKIRDAEESLLYLTPRWPEPGRVKALFVEIMLQSQVGTWLIWAALSLVVFWLGWIRDEYRADCIFVMFAASGAACSSFLAALSRRGVREFSWVTVLILLCCASGVAVFVWGPLLAQHAQVLGVGLVGAPLIVSSICFWYRPLQLPVQRVSKASG